ncbi:MAG: PLP-dependent aminotransferase family protein [Gammaproteobacteria bacterium]|nr:PLP-dependent aminotransferase family protein [Gammaproteobacteria bacterium]
MAHDTYLYEQIAEELSKAIAKGVYETGQKLPSLRYISEQYDVSMATVIQAYQGLELKGLIESRPRSGYIVSDRQQEQLEEPVLTQPKSSPTHVNVGHLAMSLINEARQPGMIRLGAAVPQAELLPLGSLSRNLAGIARRKPRAAATYETSQGNVELRKQIVYLMRESGVRCTADDIIITNGCLEAMGLALRTVAKAGDTIAIESPTYFGVLQVIESLGMKVLEIPTHASTGIDPAALAKAIRSRKVSACVLMPSFNNPIGSSMPESHKQQVVELLGKNNIPLIEDDVYGALSYETKRPKSAAAYDKTGNVLYCSSFSKTIAPGLRIGWMLAGKFHEQVIYQKFLDNISTTIYPQLNLAEFLSKGGYRRSIRHSARIYKQRMEQLRRWVSEFFPEGTRITNPKGGFLLWVELPKKYDCLKLYRKAMEKKIAITPGILFSAQGQYKNHIRLSCGSVEGEQMRKSIKVIARMV